MSSFAKYPLTSLSVSLLMESKSMGRIAGSGGTGGERALGVLESLSRPELFKAVWATGREMRAGIGKIFV